MQIRLSTIFIGFSFICVMLASYLHHEKLKTPDLVGKWYSPNAEIGLLGYWETLTIRKDGTFEKQQKYRTSTETFRGEYNVSNEGVVSFNITAKTTDGNDSSRKTLNLIHRCRIAVDDTGHLLVSAFHRYSEIDGEQIEWHYYSPFSHVEQSERKSAEIEAVLEQMFTK